MLSRLVAFFLVFGFSAVANAQTASIALSENSALFGYSMFVGGQSYGRSELGFGALYNSDETLLAEMGLQVVDEAGTKAPGLEVGIGGKLIAARVPSVEALALAIGGDLRYALPSMPRVGLGVDAFYAPNVVAFFDMENFWQLSGRIEYEVLPQAAAYLGYRRYAGRTTKSADVDFDKGVFLGLRITF